MCFPPGEDQRPAAYRSLGPGEIFGEAQMIVQITIQSVRGESPVMTVGCHRTFGSGTACDYLLVRSPVECADPSSARELAKSVAAELARILSDS